MLFPYPKNVYVGLVTGFPLVDEPFAGFSSNFLFLESLCGLPLYSMDFLVKKLVWTDGWLPIGG
jgi:hypothetical protein